ncbi:MAG: phosphoribosylamine--glycine ligase [Spirochaetota bacterium]|nr:phosphoribosylamine--glycine ligase [Spirochaetota bacterium]
MNILVIGSGGREHALVHLISRSNKVNKIFAAPGNAGIREIAECIPIEADDIKNLRQFAIENKIDWTVVGPELPLTLGLVDDFNSLGLKTFGVKKDAARLEASKSFAKKLLKKYNIPTAMYEVFNNKDDAYNYLKNNKFPIVIKADGLAAGKGVYICQSIKEGEVALNEIFIERKFGPAGNTVVIEEYLDGKEISAFAFSDGETVMPLIYAQDYKKIYEGDNGPNTGGMGSYTPVSFMTKDLEKNIYENILKPTIKALNNEGIVYQGVLYAGLMIQNSIPKVLEYNVRFGDPEAQVILPLLKTNIIDVFEAITTKTLKSIQLDWENKNAICVVLASDGYPNKYKSGFPISGLDKVKDVSNVILYHAGTKLDGDDIITSGGRVLNIIAIKNTMKEAFDAVYLSTELIQFKNKYFRNDIALKEL